MRTLTLLCGLGLCAVSASAQTAPPIQGVSGTYVPDETIKAEHEGAHGIAAGVGRIVGAAKKILPGGGKGSNPNPLNGLIEGTLVVLRDAADTSSETTTEGVVIDVNRDRRQITVRLAERKTETLRVAAPGKPADVVVSFSNRAGVKVAGDFTRVQ